MKFNLIHEHFTAICPVTPSMIAIGANWLEVKNAAHDFALQTGLEVIITKVTVIQAP